MPSHFFSDGSACSPDRPIASWPRCRLPQPSTSQQEQQRLKAIADLNLESNHSIPAFEEAIQLAAGFVGAPVGWVSVVNATHETLKATCGLSALGVGNGLAEQRQLPLAAGIGPYVLSGEEPVVIPDLTQLPALAQADLVTTYGIVACCAVPLVAAQQQCIGMLAVLDVRPRSFSQRDIGFLAMAARWGMAEYERTVGTAALKSHWPAERLLSNDTIRLGLVGQLVQDLRNPLTTVLGMTTMLSHEIYGPLTEKQREYIDIVRSSSQTLMNQVDEMADLAVTHLESTELVPTSVDIGRLGEQVRATLAPLANKFAHSLELTVQPNQQQWILDQRIVKQIIYHSLHSLIETASENSTIRMHASRKDNRLALTFWVSNSWLGDGLPPPALRLVQALTLDQYSDLEEGRGSKGAVSPAGQFPASSPQAAGLVLSQALAQHHGGQLQLHGNAAAGYRLVLCLPALKCAGMLSTLG